jgi:glycosyltransferase involved in cell wall biosynthesis
MNNGTVFIGMPVFNGAATIARSLESLLKQDYENWKLLVSDNCSVDLTPEIVAEFCLRDSRISYVRQAANIGAVGNFVYLVEQADSPFFMWAAADDEWSDNFLTEAVRVMDYDPSVMFCSPSVEVIDSAGKVLLTYDQFGEFSRHDPLFRLTNYLSMIEVSGKANPIYSLYRTSFCERLCKLPRILEGWGADMAFVTAGLCRGYYQFLPGAILRKRVSSVQDVQTTLWVAEKEFFRIPFGGEFPINLAHEYFPALIRAVPTLRLKLIVASVMGRRLLSMVFRLATGRLRWRL